jgi:hypothetical protein
MRRRFLLAAVAVIAGLTVGVTAFAAARNTLLTELTGAAEVPGPGDPAAASRRFT